jgi:peptide/nickel transport system permease protein
MLGAVPNLTPEDIARMKAAQGLDKPLLMRYANWLMRALTGDFGYSRIFSRPVLEVLGNALGRTLALMAIAFPLSSLLALIVGTIGAMRPGSLLDRTIELCCFAGISVPPFWLSLMAITVFAAILGWLPANAVPNDAAPALIERLRHLVLPVACLTVLGIGSTARYVRAAMLDALGHDHIRTARAKGCGTLRLIVMHALPTAAIPIVTVLALELGGLLSGALITEIMFGWPGMGKTLFDAVMGNDYNLALVGLLVTTAATLAGALLADLAYALIDPRVSFGATR